jgi:nitronate monooxygenase
MLTINGKTLRIPIVQGGMGIGVSLGNLAGHVMKEGGMGVISAAQPGYREPDFFTNTFNANLRALKAEIAKARSIAQGQGLLGVNLMVAGERYDEYATAIADMDIDVIISGAGLPLELPKFANGKPVALAPIVSSAKAAYLLCKRWFSRYARYPDFIVIEGPLAGGHLGFSWDDLKAKTTQSLHEIFTEVKGVLKELGISIPLVPAGGIYTGSDIAEYLNDGAAAVQMATRFIGTEECDAHPAFKAQFIQAKASDIDLVISPSGYPGRAIINAHVNALRQGRIAPTRCVKCLKPCNPATTPYCITEALIQSVSGNVDHGLVFTGTNGYRITEIVSVHHLIRELMGEMELNLT